MSNDNPVTILDVLNLQASLLPPEFMPSSALMAPIRSDSMLPQYMHTQGLFLPDKRGDYHNVIAYGAPGSGKTLLSRAVALIDALRSRNKMVFYAAPTRPLAQEAFDHFRNLGAGLLRPEDIIISTGDQSDDDWRIYQGEIKICATIFDKILTMFMSDWTIMDKTALIVIDEAHMFNEKQRGVRMDMLLAALQTHSGMSESSPRIVLLTVEGPESLKTMASMLEFWSGENLIEPLLLNGAARPNPQLHTLYICGNNGKLKEEARAFREKIPLVKFQTHEGFYPEQSTLKRMDAAIRDGMAKMANKSAKSWYMDYELIEQIAANHKNTLVVAISLKQVEQAAQNIFNKRCNSCSGLASDFRQRIGSLIGEEKLSRAHAKKLQTWADRGIFIHSALLRQEARKMVEDVFHDDQHDGNYLLISTTTLAYGVNLRLDAVIINGIIMQRHDDKLECMDSIMYHNIMGRAGRFDDVTGNCALILPARINVVDAEKELTLRQRICEATVDCYKPRPMSCLDPNPLHAPADDSNRQTMFLYALRIAWLCNGKNSLGATAEDVAGTLALTVHARIAAITDQDLETGTRKYLDELAELEYEGIRLVEIEEIGIRRFYRTTPRADYLLESNGDFRESIRMGMWLDSIKTIFDDREKSLLAPVWVGALLASPQIRWHMGRVYGSPEWLADNPKMKESATDSEMIRLACECGLTMEQAGKFRAKLDLALRMQEMRVYLFEEVERNQNNEHGDLRSLVQPENLATSANLNRIFRRAYNRGIIASEAFAIIHARVLRSKRLLLAVWLWLNGSKPDEVETTLYNTVSNGCSIFYHMREQGKTKKTFENYLPPQLMEQLSWRMRMLAGIFGGSRLMSAADMRIVANLAKRLMVGLPDDVVPFYGASRNRNAAKQSAIAFRAGSGSRWIKPSKYYYTLQMRSLCSWLHDIGAPKAAEAAEYLLSEMIDLNGEMPIKAMAKLKELSPWFDWETWLARNEEPFGLIWNGVICAGLLQTKVLPERAFAANLPCEATPLFHLFDVYDIPFEIYSSLAFIHFPLAE